MWRSCQCLYVFQEVRLPHNPFFVTCLDPVSVLSLVHTGVRALLFGAHVKPCRGGRSRVQCEAGTAPASTSWLRSKWLPSYRHGWLTGLLKWVVTICRSVSPQSQQKWRTVLMTSFPYPILLCEPANRQSLHGDFGGLETDWNAEEMRVAQLFLQRGSNSPWRPSRKTSQPPRLPTNC